MFEIILISHGPLSKAMLETAQMIVGEQGHVTCFGLYLGDSVDLFRERVEEEIRNKLEESDVLVLTDMQSGSPFNVTVGAMGYYEFRHFTGMNLPMVLEIFSRRAYESLDEVCQDLLLSTKETMVDVNQLLYELDTAF